MSMNKTRRRFLRAAAAGGVLYAFGRTPGTVMAQVSSVSGFSDYKALVCIFLFGGNDSWNMVVPASSAEWNLYKTSRQNLAVDQSTLLPITLQNAGSQTGQFGFNPNMPELKGLFDSGHLAVIANVGPLIAPTTKAQYQAGSVALPPQLFSHNDQQDQWNSLRGRAPSKTGWAGRIADVLAGQLSSQQLALNVSLSGQTLLQAGAQAVPYTIGASGPQTFSGFDTSTFGVSRRQAFNTIINATYPTVYERGYATVQKRATQFADLVNQALAAGPKLATVFPTDSATVPNATLRSLATQLQTVARLISVRAQLNMSRQIFFVSIGGFDTHSAQLTDQPGLYAAISGALKPFYDATVELGVANSVTTFTQSDFARTLSSNGDGSDHAWGGVQLALGGAVQGQSFYGRYPLLKVGAAAATEGADDVSGGRFIPTISSDQYAATLAKWLGVTDANLGAVAPSLANFTQRDLGFLV
jgi:uncharacterized protein (DUF1501 family)